MLVSYCTILSPLADFRWFCIVIGAYPWTSSGDWLEFLSYTTCPAPRGDLPIRMSAPYTGSSKRRWSSSRT
jgi:hypothetical protein